MSCRVRGCRFPDTHLTRAHVCGICKQRGHGQMEHDSPEWIEILEGWAGSEPPLPVDVRCTVPNCREPWSHTSMAHHCDGCGFRGVCLDCNLNFRDGSSSDDDTEWPPHPPLQVMSVMRHRRRVRAFAPSPQSDDASVAIRDTRRLASRGAAALKAARCPLCRTYTTVEPPVYVSVGAGSADESAAAVQCCVCMTPSLPLCVFSSCRHACVCETCLKRM